MTVQTNQQFSILKETKNNILFQQITSRKSEYIQTINVNYLAQVLFANQLQFE